MDKIDFFAPSLLHQESARCYSRQIDQAAMELESSEVAGRCHARRIFRSIEEAIVAVAMVHRQPRGANRGLQARGRWRLGPLAASFAGTWGILRLPPAVISSPVRMSNRGLCWRGRLQPAKDRCSNGTEEVLSQADDSPKSLLPPRSSQKSSLMLTWQNLVVTDPVPGSLVLWSPHDQLQDTGKRLLWSQTQHVGRERRMQTAPGGTWFQCCAPAKRCSAVPGGPRERRGYHKIKLQNRPRCNI